MPAWRPFPRTRSGSCSRQEDTSARVLTTRGWTRCSLTLPVSWRGTIAQYVGRLHRLHDGKREVQVYDYADLNVPMLARMFDRRCRGYEAVGYTILLPASAVPGWPAEVPLPVDPQWKSEYAASVRRLVRDGLDLPLARLFADAACGAGVSPASSKLDVPPEMEGIARARSASEAFLYRRLETLPEAAGLFRLNAPLAIPFDGWGQMEVDLLWAEGAWRSSSTVPSISRTWKPIVATGERTSCCRRTVTSCCGFSPRTWASTSTRCSTRSCERCRSGGGDRSGGGCRGPSGGMPA